MNIEKIDRVVFGVRDVIGVANFLSELLKTRFDRLDPELVVQGRKAIAALSPIGIELHDISLEEKEGIRRVYLRVTDLNEAKAEMEREGIRIDFEIKAGRLRELILRTE